MIYSPLDQFKIAPLISIQFAGIELSAATSFFITLLVMPSTFGWMLKSSWLLRLKFYSSLEKILRCQAKFRFLLNLLSFVCFFLIPDSFLYTATDSVANSIDQSSQSSSFSDDRESIGDASTNDSVREVESIYSDSTAMPSLDLPSAYQNPELMTQEQELLHIGLFAVSTEMLDETTRQNIAAIPIPEGSNGHLICNELTGRFTRVKISDPNRYISNVQLDENDVKFFVNYLRIQGLPYPGNMFNFDGNIEHVELPRNFVNLELWQNYEASAPQNILTNPHWFRHVASEPLYRDIFPVQIVFDDPISTDSEHSED